MHRGDARQSTNRDRASEPQFTFATELAPLHLVVHETWARLEQRVCRAKIELAAALNVAPLITQTAHGKESGASNDGHGWRSRSLAKINWRHEHRRCFPRRHRKSAFELDARRGAWYPGCQRATFAHTRRSGTVARSPQATADRKTNPFADDEARSGANERDRNAIAISTAT